MSYTDDPNDPRLIAARKVQSGLQEVYLILSDEERAKGFVRPVRNCYRHIGIGPPIYPTRELTEDERLTHMTRDYVLYEIYPEGSSACGRFWTKAQLESIYQGCNMTTTMSNKIAETYARNPGFYGSTFCATCGNHYPVGIDGEFVWEQTNELVGT
jgi:hypothetical protein